MHHEETEVVGRRATDNVDNERNERDPRNKTTGREIIQWCLRDVFFVFLFD
jgi:hypothetical protein